MWSVTISFHCQSLQLSCEVFVSEEFLIAELCKALLKALAMLQLICVKTIENVLHGKGRMVPFNSGTPLNV